MNEAVIVKVEETKPKARTFRDGSGAPLKHTAEINPFFEGVFRRYHCHQNPMIMVDPDGNLPTWLYKNKQTRETISLQNQQVGAALRVGAEGAIQVSLTLYGGFGGLSLLRNGKSLLQIIKGGTLFGNSLFTINNQYWSHAEYGFNNESGEVSDISNFVDFAANSLSLITPDSAIDFAITMLSIRNSMSELNNGLLNEDTGLNTPQMQDFMNIQQKDLNPYKYDVRMNPKGPEGEFNIWNQLLD